MARSDDDHEVGYGKPRGRPKRPVAIELKRSFNGFHDALLKEMERYVPLREGGVAMGVFATVRTDNAVMRASLERAGFTPAGQIYEGREKDRKIGVLLRAGAFDKAL